MIFTLAVRTLVITCYSQESLLLRLQLVGGRLTRPDNQGAINRCFRLAPCRRWTVLEAAWPRLTQPPSPYQ